MRKYATLLLLLFCSGLIMAQTKNEPGNKHLADSLGADEYGMKPYVLAILKTGSNTTDNKKEVDSLFDGHMANIGKLVKEGKLIVAGPLGKKDKNYRGIFILNVKTIEEAQALVQTDPAISSKLLECELYKWYGSAALPMYLDYHKQIEQYKH